MLSIKIRPYAAIRTPILARTAYGGGGGGGPFRSPGRDRDSYREREDRPRREPLVPGMSGNFRARPSPSGDSGRPARPPRPPITLTPKPPRTPLHLATLADLAPAQISKIIISALTFKQIMKSTVSPAAIRQSLTGRTIALLFNKRSTRTRVASETATKLLGGHPMFLGSADIQLGVNETLQDSAKVIGSMVDGIMARVGEHSEIEELIQHSPVPVINALSKLYHPTQILADLMTLHEAYSPEPTIPPPIEERNRLQTQVHNHIARTVDPLSTLKGKKIAWVGDINNIINEFIVTVPRLGMELSIAAPKGYDVVDPAVWARVEEANTQPLITITNSPAEALKDADIVVTDTWISMGMEAEKQERLEAFKGYQITNQMVNDAGAKPDWKFLHCLPRKQEEVDDEVFYGERSLVFPEAENRKWTTVACFDYLFGLWDIPERKADSPQGSE